MQLWLLWLALELDRVGDAALDEGLDLRPLSLKGAMPEEAPSGKINFSRSSKLVRPLAEDKLKKPENNETKRYRAIVESK